MPQTKLGNLDGYVRLAHADGGVLATVRSIVNIPRLLHDTIVGEVYLVDSFSGHEAQICGAALKLCCNIGEAVKRTDGSAFCKFGQCSLITGFDCCGIGPRSPLLDALDDGVLAREGGVGQVRNREVRVDKFVGEVTADIDVTNDRVAGGQLIEH